MGGLSMTAAAPVSTDMPDELTSELTMEEARRLSELAHSSGKSVQEYVTAYVHFVMNSNEEATSTTRTIAPIVFNLSSDDLKKLSQNMLGILLRQALKDGFIATH